MNFWSRAVRHARITLKNYVGAPSPPFFIFFINSICNQKCEHCFYWRSLNSKDDLTFDEIVGLSRSLGRIENLNLSGGEPFLRPEFSDICKQFIRHNGVRQIYVPTNGTFKERTIRHVKAILEEKDLDLFVVEHSLDGMPEFHDRFRGQRDGFAKSIETYDALAEVQKSDPRLRIHAISTATDVNMDEIRRLTTYLFERCPQMDHHNLAMIRGDRKNPALQSPRLKEYKDLYEYVQRLWGSREHGRYGASVEPLLQWAKGRTAAKQTQVVPCRAGVLSAVVYANGDVSVCENHEPIGNLRQHSFPEIWRSDRARALRQSIRRKECHCTNEVFLWPSIVYQPIQLLRAMIGAKPWRAVPPLAHEERAFVPLEALGALRAKSGAPSASEWKPDQVGLPILSEPPA
ncbi:MAG TPA: radical SAM protein [Isosphaeraceae bacterium]|nr:radical SAM protein [Isosphaeraceae bacterium]